jgi:hypothetical protein
METDSVAPAKGKMSPVLIAVLVIVGLCLLGCIVSVCLVFILPMMGLSILGPAVNSQFSDISTQIALTLTP